MKLISTLLSLSIILLGTFSMAQSYQKQIDSLENVKSKCISEEDFDCAKNAKNLIAQYEKLQKAIEDEDFELAKKIKSNLNTNETLTNNDYKTKIYIYGHQFLNDLVTFDARQISLLMSQGYYVKINNTPPREIKIKDTIQIEVTDTILNINFYSGSQRWVTKKEVISGSSYFFIANLTNKGPMYLPKLFLQEIDSKTFNSELNYSLKNNIIKEKETLKTTFYFEKLLDGGRTVFVNGRMVTNKIKKSEYITIDTPKNKLSNLQLKFNYEHNPNRYYLRFEEVQFAPGKNYSVKIILKNAYANCYIEEIPLNELDKFKNKYKPNQR